MIETTAIVTALAHLGGYSEHQDAYAGAVQGFNRPALAEIEATAMDMITEDGETWGEATSHAFLALATAARLRREAIAQAVAGLALPALPGCRAMRTPERECGAPAVTSVALPVEGSESLCREHAAIAASV